MSVIPKQIPCPICSRMIDVTNRVRVVSAECNGHVSMITTYEYIDSDEDILQRLRESWKVGRDYYSAFMEPRQAPARAQQGSLPNVK